MLFAAGMSLLDTIDGSFMNFAYGWAFSQPGAQALLQRDGDRAVGRRRARDRRRSSSLSVAGRHLGLHGAIWDRPGSVDLSVVGYAVVGLFVLTWAIALAVWRVGRIEERWALPGEPA